MHHSARESLTTSALRRFRLATSFDKDITGWSTPALRFDSKMFALLPSHPAAPRLRLSFHPRFDGATAWLDAYTRDLASSTNDGPPSSWSRTSAQGIPPSPKDGGDEEVFWDAVIADAAASGTKILQLNGKGLTYVPSAIGSLTNLVLL